MQPNQIIELFVQDVAVELNDEFDRNFERKAFFDEMWIPEKMKNSRGSQMLRTGTLRASIHQTVLNDIITWQSSLPYASIHNEGGEITVTANMKKFFWAMYMKTLGAEGKVYGEGDKKISIWSSDSKEKVKKTLKSKTKKAETMKAEAMQWKYLALMKVGTKLKIPKRQFIGEHPQVHQVIQDVFNDLEPELNEYVLNHLKK